MTHAYTSSLSFSTVNYARLKYNDLIYTPELALSTTLANSHPYITHLTNTSHQTHIEQLRKMKFLRQWENRRKKPTYHWWSPQYNMYSEQHRAQYTLDTLHCAMYTQHQTSITRHTAPRGVSWQDTTVCGQKHTSNKHVKKVILTLIINTTSLYQKYVPVNVSLPASTSHTSAFWSNILTRWHKEKQWVILNSCYMCQKHHIYLCQKCT